jgi:hypothetical protein
MAIAGRVAIVPKGDWSADAAYKRLDAVTYNNTLYFAKKEVPAGTATSNTEYWSKSIVGGVGAIATTEEAGIVKPDGKSMSVDESGTLSINLDGTTITLDEAKNVIKLADTLKDKIGSALQPESIVNNQITTETGYALDARQANPNIDGTLAKQLSDLNGSLKMIDCGASAFSESDSAINPGTIISTSVTFNKKFNGRPIVIVSWAERNCNTYLGMINVDNRKVTADGFECNTTLKVADSWKYSWIFYWIAIEQ